MRSCDRGRTIRPRNLPRPARSPSAPRSRKWRPKLCQRSWDIPRLLAIKGIERRTRSASVKAVASRRDGDKRGIQDCIGNLHEIRHIGPHERGANALIRIELSEHSAIKGELGNVSPWYIGEAARRGTIGLVVGDQDRIIGHCEAIDLAGDGKPAALEASDDRNLSAASRQKQLGEAWIVEQPLDLLDHELTLLIGEFTGRSRKIAP